MNYVIIQAGGKGQRLEKYTYNKPKALLSIDSMPMIFHTFNSFKQAKFIIIGDYKYYVLRDYLKIFSEVDFVIIKASEKGTLSGLTEALNFIPNESQFLYIWSDLVIPKIFQLNIEKSNNYIGISKDFECRWSYRNGDFVEERSKEFGVAGFFIFKNKEQLKNLPESGEFVKYLKDANIKFETLDLYGVREFGLKEEYEKYIFGKKVSRPFNSVSIENTEVIKIPLDKKGKELSAFEINWYKYVVERNYKNIPAVLNYNPLTLEKINGLQPFSFKDLGVDEKKLALDKIIEAYNNLHNLSDPIPSNFFSLEKEYYQKTFKRMEKVFKLIPFATQKEIKINNKIYLNPFFVEEDIKNMIRSIYPKKFHPIHGDPTFSNIIFSEDFNKVFLIDPRGYFGYNTIYGDKDYDYAKLYYSLKGNYDKFNQKHFVLKIEENGVMLDIESNGFEKLEEYFFNSIGWNKKFKIQLLHAIIWLSLTTYAWDDYDSICGAFYNGILKLGEVL